MAADDPSPHPTARKPGASVSKRSVFPSENLAFGRRPFDTVRSGRETPHQLGATCPELHPHHPGTLNS